MQTAIEEGLARISFPVQIRIALALTIGLAVVPANATQSPGEEERVVVERPLVVVRSDTHGPGHVWTMGGSHSFLGVQTVDLTPELRQHFGAPSDSGVMVAKIVDDSPAAASDLRVGDIITSLGEVEIDSPGDLARAVRHREIGEVVDLEVYRDGAPMGVETTLAERRGAAIDIRQFRIPDVDLEGFSFSDEDLEGVIELRVETFNEAIEKLNEEMASPEWHTRLHSFREHQGALMDRIEELEERLQELEAELEGLGDD